MIYLHVIKRLVFVTVVAFTSASYYQMSLAQEASDVTSVSVSQFSSFASAVSSASTLGKTLLVDSPVECNNLTVPSGVTIKVTDRGEIAVAAGSTLQINGHFSSGPHHIFKGSGLIRFAHRSVSEMYPQWWGARGDNSTDCYFALKAMADAVSSAGGGRVYFPEGTYLIAQTKTGRPDAGNAITDIVYRDCKTLQIVGNNAAISLKGNFRRTSDYSDRKRAFRYSYMNSLTPFKISNCQDVLLSGFEVDGNVDEMTRDSGVAESSAHGIIIEGGRSIIIKDVNVHHCQTDGLYLTGSKSGDGSLIAARNVRLERVTSSHNARQGLSVIQAKDVVIVDSVFSYSGVTGGEYGGHAPMAGVDIEPNLSFNSTPRVDVLTGNIIFDKCRFEHSAGSQVAAAYADRIEKVSFKNCSIDATGSPSRFSMIFAVADGLIEDSRIETGSGNFNIGWSSPYVNLQKTVVRRCKITGSKNVILCATEGAVLIEGCNIRNTAAVLERNTYVPYLMDKNCIFRNNRIFVPKPGATDQRKYQIANRLNVAESSNNIFETDLSNTDYHLASGYGKYTRVINDSYSGSFRPFPNAKWEARRPYSK